MSEVQAAEAARERVDAGRAGESVDGEATLVVEDLSVGYRQPDRGVLRVVAAVDLELHPGRVLGLAGESGCGKSTAALAAVGYRHPGGVVLGGRSLLGGRDLLGLPHSALRVMWGRRVAYISQNAATSLNPALTIGRHFDEVLRRHVGLHGSQMAERELELLESVGIPEPQSALHRYPHQLSGGQQQRVALALAFACRPSVLVLDEPTTGLDVTTQAKMSALLRVLIEETNVAVLYVSHDLALLSTFVSDVSVMYAGEIVERGPVEAIVGAPQHPYTHALLRAVPSAHAPRAIRGIAGEPPVSVCDESCAFAPRCQYVVERCRSEHPELRALEPDRVTRCFRAEELKGELELVSATGGDALLRETAATKPGTPQLLEVDRVSCYYGARQRRVTAVRDVSFSVSDAEVLGIVGLSGSGKSTLLRAIVGLQDDVAGTISFRGQPMVRSAVKRPLPVRRQVQIVFQDPGSSLNPRHTVRDIIGRAVRLFRQDVSRKDNQAAVEELLERVKLSRSFLPRYPSELSGGQQQRVAIARAFAARPSLLLCDEVTSALDVSVAATIIELLRDLTSSSQTAVIFVSHDLAVVRTLADRAIVMRDGAVCEEGPTGRLFSRPEHPYTIELLSAIPDIAHVGSRRGPERGQPTSG
jgi:peptide/nickel transport system ATP-binding protein